MLFSTDFKSILSFRYARETLVNNLLQFRKYVFTLKMEHCGNYNSGQCSSASPDHKLCPE